MPLSSPTNIPAPNPPSAKPHSGDLVIDGNVGPDTGNIHALGAVTVIGTVLSQFVVRSGADVEIRQAVEMAEVIAQKNLRVGGGIIGGGKGRCVAGRDLSARFLSQANITVGGDVSILTDATDSRIICTGKLDVSHGELRGGLTIARGGIVCKYLGSPSGANTPVEAGIDQRLCDAALESLPTIEADIIRIHKIRKTVGPLMSNIKALTAKQREQATELLYEADERESQVLSTVRRLSAMYEECKSAAKGEVAVTETLFPGVTVRFPGVETVVTTALKGPLRIAIRQSNHERRIVLIDGVDGTVHDLPTRPWQDAPIEALDRLLKLDNPMEFVVQ